MSNLCAEPGCDAFVENGGRCPAHRRRRAPQPAPSALGYDRRWRAFARRFLASHPRCEYLGCTAPATEVHHLDGLGPNGPRGYDGNNLQALCKRCHFEIEKRRARR
ncbi:MAG: HNH endonuclease signature motif containing protein [Solirubrobacteraceae bacterium]